MKIIQDQVAGRMRLEVRGDFDTFVVAPFGEHVEQLVAEGHLGLDLDLSRVKFINTRAVSALLAARRLLAERGGELRLVAASGVVAWTLATLGVEHLLSASRQAA